MRFRNGLPIGLLIKGFSLFGRLRIRVYMILTGLGSILGSLRLIIVLVRLGHYVKYLPMILLTVPHNSATTGPPSTPRKASQSSKSGHPPT